MICCVLLFFLLFFFENKAKKVSILETKCDNYYNNKNRKRKQKKIKKCVNEKAKRLIFCFLFSLYFFKNKSYFNFFLNFNYK